MTALDSSSSADLGLTLRWQSPEGAHTERFRAATVNMWRDLLPPTMIEALRGARVGETRSFPFGPGEIMPDHDPGQVLALPRSSFRRIVRDDAPLAPRFGRFYPQGMLKGVSGIYPQSLDPMRIVEVDDRRLTVDLNHPLAGIPIEVEVTVNDLLPHRTERGGHGPGMQARWQGRPTDFAEPQAFRRQSEDDDAAFYRTPRLVGHIDRRASDHLRTIYERELAGTDRVLDLMSSGQSHLDEEMATNPVLAEAVVHDLNRRPLLPFADNEFDAVLCSLSIEYLTDPQAVIAEAHRVLRPGGRILISFSNRWFPPKATTLWLGLHEFERLGLVLDYLLGHGGFSRLATESIRNWPRPADDRHRHQLGLSDPIYLVRAEKTATA